MSAHTPGPWNVVGPDDDPYGEIGIFSSAMPRLVCQLWQDDAPVHDYNREQWANARMIAAAPEMYDALKDYLEWGAMTSSDRHLHETKFRELLARIDGQAVNL